MVRWSRDETNLAFVGLMFIFMSFWSGWYCKGRQVDSLPPPTIHSERARALAIIEEETAKLVSPGLEPFTEPNFYKSQALLKVYQRIAEGR